MFLSSKEEDKKKNLFNLQHLIKLTIILDNRNKNVRAIWFNTFFSLILDHDFNTVSFNYCFLLEKGFLGNNLHSNYKTVKSQERIQATIWEKRRKLTSRSNARTRKLSYFLPAIKEKKDESTFKRKYHNNSGT